MVLTQLALQYRFYHSQIDCMEGVYMMDWFDNGESFSAKRFWHLMCNMYSCGQIPIYVVLTWLHIIHLTAM